MASQKQVSQKHPKSPFIVGSDEEDSTTPQSKPQALLSKNFLEMECKEEDATAIEVYSLNDVEVVTS